jgi:hypothetical protein
MLRALYDAGVCGKCWAAVASLFDQNRSVVKIPDTSSEEYEITNGCREGAILSPICYVLFINTLLNNIRKTQKGLSFPHPETGTRVMLFVLSIR